MKTEAELQELFALSALVGETLQQSGFSPADSVSTLIITLGRLLAREGFDDVTAEDAFQFVLNDDTKYFFLWGHQEERSRGHHGPHRVRA